MPTSFADISAVVIRLVLVSIVISILVIDLFCMNVVLFVCLYRDLLFVIFVVR